jgi:hypothetical protein
MKNKLLLLFLILGLGVFSCQKEPGIEEDYFEAITLKSSSSDIDFCGVPEFIYLSEGEGEDQINYVEVKVFNDKGFLYVEFTNLREDYNIDKTTVVIDETEYSNEGLIYQFDLSELEVCEIVSVTVSLKSKEPIDFVYSHLEELAGNLIDEEGLPGTVSLTVQYFGITDSYFESTVDDPNFGLDGTWDGWCVDLEPGISSGLEYSDVKVYSSYDDPSTLSEVVDKPENLAKVNFVLSQNYVGKEAACGGTFSRSDVQRAIWALIDDEGAFDPVDGPLVVGGGLVSTEMSLCKVQEILDAADAAGESFVPECTENEDGTFTYKVAVILDPNTESITGQVTIGQVTVIELVEPCELVPVFDHKEFTGDVEYCIEECPVPDDPGCDDIPGAFRTQSMGGWGSPGKGNNPGAYRDANFENAFPEGLVVGGKYTLTLTSAKAVQNFLPQGGKPAALKKNWTNPKGRTGLGNFAGQVVALKLSVGFDYADPNFGSADYNLADLVFLKGTFAGMTIGQVLAEAEKVLGGERSSYTLQQLHSVVTQINEHFVDGKRVADPDLFGCGGLSSFQPNFLSL